ncbi:hypothetical protein GR702_17580 [Novosphingobium sp. FGD1]|uniref:Uncharacterized protein n=1 Tax=Novosphingobium silvae TaxID=2692619 RepID=A0A7X4GJR9_9SPHN|nr:hypothetical protein [Novosphingobium silvae]MYL99575.1 hypothetical protein [Novosphingobium silvae]
MSAYSDLGPQGPTRMEVCLVATDVMRMAAQAREMCGTGPNMDLGRALRIQRAAHTKLAELTAPVEDGDADD